MSTIQESGHIKNIMAFEQLISYCKGFGAAYNPNVIALQISSLENKHSTALSASKASDNADIVYDKTGINRQLLFSGLGPLATRVVNALDATPAPVQVVKDAKLHQKKISGSRVTPLPGKTTGPDGKETTPVTHSGSQKSFDKLLEHFFRLIAVVTNEPHYSPNETDIAVSGLQTKYEVMSMAHSTCMNAKTQKESLEILRDKELYEENTGLVPTAFDVKKYIKSVFGASSKEFKQVNALNFRNYRRK